MKKILTLLVAVLFCSQVAEAQSIGCEELMLENGDLESIKVTEVHTTTIKYKRCKDGKTRGVTFVVNKNDIKYILHTDGHKETFGDGGKEDTRAGNASEFGCDELMLKNGDIESVKVTEVNSNTIKYKRCKGGSLSGISFVAKKTDIYYLKYANGQKELFDQDDDQYGCDKLALKNGDVELIRVIEVNSTTIKYKSCSDGVIRGVTFAVKKKDVITLQYANGYKEEYGDE